MIDGMASKNICICTDVIFALVALFSLSLDDIDYESAGI